jgi:hypothetical protein
VKMRHARRMDGVRRQVSVRDTLHRWIDDLREEDLPAAQRALQPLRGIDSLIPLDEAPLDNEPDDDDFDGGLTEARADVQAGRVVSHDEVKRRWGIT